MLLGLLDKYCMLNEVPIFGNRRKRAMGNLRNKFGDFTLAHYVGKLRSQKDVVNLFEEAYFEHLSKNSELLEWLVTTASDVYDKEPEDTESGLDYSKQGEYTHLQDIAIRRVIKRFGKQFEGKQLLRVRSKDPDGNVLSPGNVPFHKTELINNFNHNKQWWKPGSVEDFYQKSKALLVKPKTLKLLATIANSTYVETETGTYRIDKDNLEVLIKDVSPTQTTSKSPEFSSYSLNRHLREKYSKPITFDLDALIKKNPLELSSTREYIGVITELMNSIIEGADLIGSTSGNNKVTRVSQYGKGIITEVATFKTPGYSVTLKGDIPDMVYAGLLKLESIFKCLSENSYTTSIENINSDFCSGDLSLGLSVDEDFKTSFTYKNANIEITKSEN